MSLPGPALIAEMRHRQIGEVPATDAFNFVLDWLTDSTALIPSGLTIGEIQPMLSAGGSNPITEVDSGFTVLGTAVATEFVAAEGGISGRFGVGYLLLTDVAVGAVQIGTNTGYQGYDVATTERVRLAHDGTGLTLANSNGDPVGSIQELAWTFAALNRSWSVSTNGFEGLLDNVQIFQLGVSGLAFYDEAGANPVILDFATLTDLLALI